MIFNRVMNYCNKLSLIIYLILVLSCSACEESQYDQNFVAQTPYTSWSFGVMADTQWFPDDEFNPNTVAVEIIRQLNEKFIEHNVKFVIQVGDLTDLGWNPVYGDKAIDTRALFTQELYNHGIGFYPIRGNHEGSPEAAREFTRVFPQTRGGSQNATPVDVLGKFKPDSIAQPLPPISGTQFILGSNFNSPNSELSGLSYSFDYDNTRFILLDNFPTADNTSYSFNEQQSWITDQLSSRPANTHSFVLTHYTFDAMFSAEDQNGRNELIRSMSANSAKYLISGHVHRHVNKLLFDSNDKSTYIHTLICASDSAKFYMPLKTYPESFDPLVAPVSEEALTVGYYIFTITGPNLTVDYYSAQVDPSLISGAYQIITTPQMNFTKRETFGYSLVGKESVIEQGQPYEEKVNDTYSSRAGALPTSARILGGANDSTSTDYSGRPLSKTVNTGWSQMIESTASDIFSIWGMQVLNDQQPEVFPLSISYYPTRVNKEAILSGRFGIAAKDAAGKWVNASVANAGGTPSFVIGPWDPSYGLGTYGVDSSNNTVWAVLNYAGEFAAAEFQE
jgi:hypothetical protein